MARNVVFLIHGAGSQGADWATRPGGALETLQQVSQQYSFFEGKEIEELIEFVPIRYDDIFDRILEHWEDLAKNVREGAGELLTDDLQSAVGLAERAGDDNAAFIRRGGDVVLYRGFRLFAQRVLIRVLSVMSRKIAERVEEVVNTPTRFSVIAHSLGTTVAHDALHHLGTENWKPVESIPEEAAAGAEDEVAEVEASISAMASSMPSPFRPESFRLTGLYMLSNTSRLLHTTDKDPYESIVRPGTGGHPDSYCKHFYNYRHSLDPIWKVKSFVMPTLWKLSGGQEATLDHVHQKNVHDLGHYLRHPKVHLPLFVETVNGYAPNPDDVKILNDFPTWGGAFASPDPNVESALRTVVEATKRKTSLRQWFKIVSQYADLLQSN